ncbi:MAG: ABC transporter ATP-binding protein [Burkholderiaceae bacterium]
MLKAMESIDAVSVRRLVGLLGSHVRRHRRTLALGTMAMIVATAASLLAPWPLKLVFDGLLIPQSDPDPVTAWALRLTGGGDTLLIGASVAILAIALIAGAAGYAQGVLISGAGQRIVADIRLDLYRHIQRLSHSFHDQASSGDLLARLTGDVRMMRDLLVNAVIYSSSQGLIVLATIGIMLWLDWRLTIAGVIILPALMAVSRHFAGRIRGAARRQRRKEGRIANVMSENLGAMAVVKGFAREAHEEARFARQNHASTEAGLVATRLEGHMDRLVQVILAFGTMMVVWYGVKRVYAGAISPGDLLVFTAYLRSLYKPVRKLAGLTGRVAKAVASGERLLEVFDLRPEVDQRADARPAPSFRGDVCFESVSFDYGGRRPVFDRASLQIAAGEIVAVVGDSGVGKSTAMQLLLRFYDPAEGRVLIDGVDIRDLTLDSLREQFAIVLQDTVLFGTTIRENIAYGRLNADDDAIVAAARIAGADDFICRLPDGYETVVGERGKTLSGGQRQRIAIARAVVRDARILILDEPLNGLDATTAAEVSQALARAARNRTTLIVTHDTASLPFVDRIVRVADGRFVDEAAATRTLLTDTAT